MIDEIINSFPLGIKTYITSIERVLNNVYTRFDFKDKHSKRILAKGTDIEHYFNCRRYNGKVKIKGIYESYYILDRPKYRTSSEFKR